MVPLPATTPSPRNCFFFERALVEQELDAFARRGLAFGVLLLDGFLAAAQLRFLAEFDELFDFFQLFTHCVSDVFESFVAVWVHAPCGGHRLQR